MDKRFQEGREAKGRPSYINSLMGRPSQYNIMIGVNKQQDKNKWVCGVAKRSRWASDEIL